MSNVSVSFIVCINVEQYLSMCMNSLLQQTYADFEIIRE